VKLEGSLDAFSLPDIFQLLSFTKKSGGLRLSNGSSVGVVYFVEGLVTGATADGSRQSLARRLIGSGVIDDATLERAVASVPDGSGVGRWLLESGGVDSELIRQAATEQSVDAVFDLLRWGVGDFAFQVDVANPDDVGVRLTTEAVVSEATQRQAAWESVTAVISGPDTLLAMPVVLGVEPTVTRDEWALLALVDGRRRVGDLVELTGCGQYAVVSTLAGLVTRGLLQVPDADDHVSAVLRRQALLAAIERRGANQRAEETPEGVPGEVEQAGPVASEDVPVETPETDLAAIEDDDEPQVEADVEPEPVAGPEIDPDEPPEIEDVDDPVADNRAPAPLLGRAHVPGNVVPPRPEPFLPQRKPDHPESLPAARLTAVPSVRPVVGNTALAEDPETAGLIERDPSVNRSLLLRLIAGVRGL
jgi:hypothetical protein